MATKKIAKNIKFEDALSELEAQVQLLESGELPLDKALENGTVVFNTPGGNANAVKELVLASMIIASRNIVAAANWSANAKPGADITLRTEKEKTSFNGTELLGKMVKMEWMDKMV